MTKRSRFSWPALTVSLLVACAAKPPPVPKPEPTTEPESLPPEPPPSALDAGAREAVDAAPSPGGKSIALCAVPTDPSKAQCLTWTGCAGGIVETYAGNPVRKCAASAEDCAAAEKKLVDESEKLKASGGGAARVCKLRNYLKKEIRIEGVSVFVCPEDADDRPLSELWRQIAGTCKEPIAQ